MYRWKLLLCLTVAAFLLLGASTSERPKLRDCGKHLPQDAQYSVLLEASWDRRPESISNNFYLSYRNDDPDSNIEPDSAEVRQFQQCIEAALGK